MSSPCFIWFEVWLVVLVVVLVVFAMVSGFGDVVKKMREGEGEEDRERREFYRYGCIGE